MEVLYWTKRQGPGPAEECVLLSPRQPPQISLGEVLQPLGLILKRCWRLRGAVSVLPQNSAFGPVDVFIDCFALTVRPGGVHLTLPFVDQVGGAFKAGSSRQCAVIDAV